MQNTKNRTVIGFDNSLLDFYPKQLQTVQNNCTQKDICTPMFMTALFKLGKS